MELVEVDVDVDVEVLVVVEAEAVEEEDAIASALTPVPFTQSCVNITGSLVKVISAH